MKLKDIAMVKTGLVLARKASEPMNAIYHKYMQLNLKCIQLDGTIDKSQLDTFESGEELSSNYLTQVNDVIIRLVVPNTAVLIDESTENLVVPSHFCIVRAIPGKAIPAFIQWFLNSDIVRAQLARGMTGTSIANVRPGLIGDLLMSPIPLAEQQIIGDVYRLGQKELRLMESLKEAKAKQYKLALDAHYRKILE